MTAWTPNLIESVIEAWNRGDSTNGIAKRFGLTRNQVLGKINRLRNQGFDIQARGEPISVRNSDKTGRGIKPKKEGCLFIAGDPIEALKANIDPHCGKERIEGSSYCAAHKARVYIPGSSEKRKSAA